MPRTTPEYPSWLKDEKGLIKRFETAAKRKDPWIPHLRTCYQYTLPYREIFYLYTPGDRRNIHIFDSTGTDAIETYANQIQARLMPPWRKFAKLTPGTDHLYQDGKPIQEETKQKLQESLDTQTDILFGYLNHSNMATQVNEACLDVGISTGALTLEPEYQDGILSLVFNAVPLAELVIEEGPNGLIETVWRKRKIHGRNIERTWKGAKLGDKLSKKVNTKDGKDKEFEFVEGVIYDPKTDWYFGVAIELSCKESVWEADYEISPWIVFRSNVVSGEIYGRGPAQRALPTILTANKVVEYILRNGALAVAGAYTSTDVDVINPYTMQVAPGTVIPVRSNLSTNPTLRPLERSGDFNVADLILDDLRKSIKSAFKVSQRRPEGPVRSAYEVALENLEDVEQNGTSYGRLQTELVARVIRRAVNILQREGKMAPISVNGKDVDIQYTSPLARAQDSEDILALQQYQEAVAPLGPEVLMMNFKVEDVPKYVAEKSGLPAKLLRDEPEKAEIQEKVSQMIAAMMTQGTQAPG